MKRQQSTRDRSDRASDSRTTLAPGHAAARSWALIAVLTTAVALLVLVTHLPALSAQAMSFDDEEAITDNYLVRNPSWNSVGRFFTEVLRPSAMKGYYRPLTMTSLMLDWAAGGRPENLRPFHRTSLALHILNTALVILLCNQLFGQPWVAAMIGLLFGLHPLTVEPIVWVMERKTLLAAFFAFACLNLYARYARQSGWTWYAGAWLMCVFALMSKPTSVPLPVVLLLLDYWPLRRLSWRTVVEKVPFFVIGGAFAVITFLCEERSQGLTLPGEYSLAQLPLRIGYLLMFYLSKIAWPVHLSSVYPLPEPLALSNPVVVLSVLGTCVLIVALVLSWRWTPALVVGSLVFFLAISPTLGLVGYSWVSASDKYVYLPSIGLLVVLCWFLGRCWGTSPGAARLLPRRVGVVMVMLMLAGLEHNATRNYLLRWQDSETLFRYMLRLTPQAYRLHNHLGFILAEKGQTEEAIQHYHQALQFRPGFPRALNNLGITLAEQGKTDEAIQHYKQALRRGPGHAAAHNNLGLALASQGKNGEAIQHYRQALRLKPEYPTAYNNLGVVLIEEGKTAEATRCYRRALQLNPELPAVHNNLGTALTYQHQHDEALRHYNCALQLKPDFAEAHSNLGNVLIQRGRVNEAIQHYEQALQLQPDSPDALNNLAWALATHDIASPPEGVDPVQLAERACTHSDYKRPDYLDTLAACYAAAGRFQDAVTTAKKAIELANAADQAPLAEDTRQRLLLYETGKSYREPPPP